MKITHAKFNSYITTHYKEIFHYVSRYTNNIEDAKDETQEIFLKAYNKSNKFNPDKASFRTWLYKIAQNHMINYINSFHIRNKVEFDSSYFENLSSTDDILESIIQNEEVSSIITLMKTSLNKKHLNIMGLYFFSDLSTNEIAELNGVTRKTVNNVIGLSINKIKSKVEELNHE